MTANKRNLKNRKAIGSTLDNEIHDKLQELTTETKIPISKLLDESINLLYNVHTISKEAGVPISVLIENTISSLTQLHDLSKVTHIPLSRLQEESIELLYEKREKQ